MRSIEPTPVLLRAKPYTCTHRVFRFKKLSLPYWIHRAYEVEIVNHGWTVAPRKSKVAEWALDWLACDEHHDGTEWEVTIEWI
jgi:hypothetical protein